MEKRGVELCETATHSNFTVGSKDLQKKKKDLMTHLLMFYFNFFLRSLNIDISCSEEIKVQLWHQVSSSFSKVK